MFSLADLQSAAALVHQSFGPTPQYEWPLLKARTGVDVIVKHENHTPAGAFKIRGGLVYFDRMKRERPHVKGVVSATRGNHGQSLAYAGARAGVPVTIVVPKGNSVEKNAAMKAFSAELIEHGADFDEARVWATEIATERGYELSCSRLWPISTRFMSRSVLVPVSVA
jgi:threonine dehydratase